jgi:hypothetical protein
MTIYNLTQNAGTDAALTPICGPLGMFSRLRLHCAGQVAEDIQEVGAFAMMLERMQPNARRIQNALMAHPMTAANLGDESYAAIPGGEARTVTFQLPFGLLNQSLWMPLASVAAGGITLECELSSTASQAFAEAAANWRIQDVKLFANMHDVDSSLANSISAHVLSGRPLPYPYQTAVLTKHFLTQANFSLNIQRSSSRLKQIYIQIYKANGKLNEFFHPVGNNAPNATNDTLEYQVTIGSRKFPQTAVQSVGETMMRYLQATGSFYGTDDASVGAANNWCHKRAVYCIDLERTGNQSLFSGINTRGGDIVVVQFKNVDTIAAGDYAIVTCVVDQIANLHGGGCDILE